VLLLVYLFENSIRMVLQYLIEQIDGRIEWKIHAP
jgi:hypothetical protein